MDLGGPNLHELHGHRPRVVVRHDPLGPYRDIVAGPDLLPGREVCGVSLDNLFGEGLGVGRGGGRLREAEGCGIGGVFKLEVGYRLPSGPGGNIGTATGRGGGKRSRVSDEGLRP